MSIQFLQYPKCGTCRNARKYLEEKGVAFEERHIVEHSPTKEELRKWIEQSGLDIRKWFNTSGKKYKELGLKDKLKDMSAEDMLELLASDGMLVKRPILINGSRVTVGFKPEEVDKILS
jgi:arsenate reductase